MPHIVFGSFWKNDGPFHKIFFKDSYGSLGQDSWVPDRHQVHHATWLLHHLVLGSNLIFISRDVGLGIEIGSRPTSHEIKTDEVQTSRRAPHLFLSHEMWVWAQSRGEPGGPHPRVVVDRVVLTRPLVLNILYQKN